MTSIFARSTCSVSSCPKSVAPSSKFHHRGSGIPRKVTCIGRKLKGLYVEVCCFEVGAAEENEKSYQSRCPPPKPGASRTVDPASAADSTANEKASRFDCQAASP